MNIILI